MQFIALQRDVFFNAFLCPGTMTTHAESINRGIVDGVLTEIIMSRNIFCHISLYIFCLNSISQTNRVREQQTWVFYAHVIVVKIVHVQFRQVEHGKAHVDGSIQRKSCHSALYSSQAISNGVASTEIRFGNPFT